MLGIEQLNSEWLVILGGVSVATFILTLLIVPLVVVRIPADYFQTNKRHTDQWMGVHPILRYLLIVLKNICGLVLLCMGILMLVLPGQGLLTMVFGIALMDFPGKFTLERRLVSYPKVLDSINWIRKKANRQPLLIN